MIVRFVNDDGTIRFMFPCQLGGHSMRSLSLATGAAGLALALILAVLGGSRGPAQVAAQTSTPWVAPAPEKAKKNPLPTDKKAIEQGEKVAKINCVSCHGPLGKGNGPAAVALNPKPADWTSKRVQDETDGELFWKITNGRGPMPSWRHLPENDRWAVVRFIRTLAGK
jgi:mono/diheme cytochrome c family protein